MYYSKWLEIRSDVRVSVLTAYDISLLNNRIGLEGVRALADALTHENNRVMELS